MINKVSTVSTSCYLTLRGLFAKVCSSAAVPLVLTLMAVVGTAGTANNVSAASLVYPVNTELQQNAQGKQPAWIEAHVGENMPFMFACLQQKHILNLQEVGKRANAAGDIRPFHTAIANSVNMGVCFASPSPITGIVVDIVDAFKTTRSPQGSHLKYWAVVIKVMNPENHDQFLYAGVDLLEPEGA